MFDFDVCICSMNFKQFQQFAVNALMIRFIDNIQDTSKNSEVHLNNNVYYSSVLEYKNATDFYQSIIVNTESSLCIESILRQNDLLLDSNDLHHFIIAKYNENLVP